MSDYKQITVKDIIDFVKGDPKNFPKGLDTPIMTS